MSTTPATDAPTQGWTADDSTFGARLALIRQRMGWGNIARAAKECGVPTDSWRNWEVDGREPHRLTTIAMTIATRAGCDYLWLVHGPQRGAFAPTREYFPSSGMRIVAAIGHQPSTTPDRMIRTRPTERPRPGRPVRQTRPLAGHAVRPHTPIAV